MPPLLLVQHTPSGLPSRIGLRLSKKNGASHYPIFALLCTFALNDCVRHFWPICKSCLCPHFLEGIHELTFLAIVSGTLFYLICKKRNITIVWQLRIGRFLPISVDMSCCLPMDYSYSISKRSLQSENPQEDDSISKTLNGNIGNRPDFSNRIPREMIPIQGKIWYWQSWLNGARGTENYIWVPKWSPSTALIRAWIHLYVSPTQMMNFTKVVNTKAYGLRVQYKCQYFLELMKGNKIIWKPWV